MKTKLIFLWLLIIIFSATTTSKKYIGLQRTENTNDAWYWVNGKRMDPSLWNPGQPNYTNNPVGSI